MAVRFGTEMVIGCTLCGKPRAECERLFGMDHVGRDPSGVCWGCAHRIAYAFLSAAPGPMPLYVIRPQTEWEEDHNKLLIASNLRRMLEDATDRGSMDDVHAIIERAKALGIKDIEAI